MQMFNFGKDQSALQVLVADLYDDLIRTNSEAVLDHLK